MSLNFKPKKTLKNEAATATAPEEDLEMSEDEDTAASSKETDKEKKRAAKLLLRQQKKEEAKAEKERQQQRQSANKKTLALANKAVGLLRTSSESLKNALDKAVKNKTSSLQQDNLREQAKVVDVWKKKALDAVVHFGKHGKTALPINLPFDEESLRSEVASSKAWSRACA